ncbi:MAG: hypothetical protein H0T89_21345 [Deltaproteobacteria bacterium]|nr:hypothetical protein [Deltaproteobacteria bacterium]MDQ3297182.1 hypothetical protein [Myxococcota bacterium]
MTTLIRNVTLCIGVGLLAMFAAPDARSVQDPVNTPSTETAGACGKCGDGYCNPRCGETATSCPRDCGGGETSIAAQCEADEAAGMCGKCGDGYCNPRCGETATSCPRDCGTSTSAVELDAESAINACGKCGDGYCNPRCGETATSCAKDCGTAS